MATLELCLAVVTGFGRVAIGGPPVRTLPLVVEVICAGILLFLAFVLLRVRASVGTPHLAQAARNAGFGALAAFGVCLSALGVVVIGSAGFVTGAVTALTGLLAVYGYLGVRRTMT